MPVVSTESASAPRLGVVNGLRGVAILGVLYFHFLSDRLTPVFGAPGIFVGPYLVSAYSLVSNGWLGVNLFFVLSGFVLALPYLHGERTLETTGDVRAFYGRRAVRLLPLYYLCLFVALLVETRGSSVVTSLEEDFSLATFTFVFHRSQFLPRINAPLWSLGVEFWFSVAFPFVLLAMRRVGVVAVTLFALVVAGAVRFSAASAWTSQAVYLLPVKDGVFGRLDDFVVGIALCHVYARRPFSSRALATVAVLLGIVVVTLSAVGWDNVVYRSVPFVACAFFNDVTLLGLGLLLLGLLGAPRAVSAPFTVRPLKLAGTMCYSIYLWHLLGMHPFEDPPLGSENVALRLGLTLLVSTLTYRFVEFPNKSLKALFVELD